MKTPKPAAAVILGLIIAALIATSCAKKPTPQERQQTRLSWNLATTVKAYESGSYMDAKWDEPARQALTEFARTRARTLTADEDSSIIIQTNCEAAVKAGCDDPLVRYLYIRYCMEQTNSAKAFADEFSDTATAMQQSSYPDIRKFYAYLRALEQVHYANRMDQSKRPTGELAKNMIQDLVTALADKTLPTEEIYEACDQGLHQLTGAQKWYEDCYQQIEKLLLANWPNEPVTWLLKGEAEIELAWFARGSGYADSVNEDQWKLFHAHLATAEESLNKAWKLDSRDVRIPLKMMTVELGQGQGRDHMELWFGRAMAVNPNDYDICQSKLNYLEPKWYGSVDAMLQFGRECVQNQQWGGHVPLILVDAHQAISQMFTNEVDRVNYWKNPVVWADVKSAFDRFFEVNPAATSWYHNYAWRAYQAEQWQTFNDIVPKLGPINYRYFGGQERFEQMIQIAREKARKPVAATP